MISSVDFSTAATVENWCWYARQSDYTRAYNRALIDSLANGAPPYQTQDRNVRSVNVNDLTMTRIGHDARSQMQNGIFGPGDFFAAKTDMGPVHKRAERSSIVTSEINKKLRGSSSYYECLRASIAQTILHGIGPSTYNNRERWCPVPIAIGDVLIPGNAELPLEDNLPFFAISRRYTPHKLYMLTHGPVRDPGWNIDAVDQALKWANESSSTGNMWASEYMQPERLQENLKSDGGFYASDYLRTIDVWDFYFWNADGKEEGWNRRMVFDKYGGWEGYGVQQSYNGAINGKNLINKENQWLYNSGKRKYGHKLSELLHCQFADLSAVAPFRYHSIRSFGFLVYSACHLQNRVKCAVAEAVFENLMMYMRVKSLDDAERALKVDLFNRGFIDESVNFLSPQERWQPNAQMIELGLGMYDRDIRESASSYVQPTNMSRDRVEKTKFQVMAEINAAMTLVSAGLRQAYHYQEQQFSEMFRRFMVMNSSDPDVRDFRARALARGVPDKMLTAEAWDISAEQVVGGGNKTMEMAITQQLIEWLPLFAPASQELIKRQAVLALTSNPSMAREIVPAEELPSKSKQFAMASFGTLMAGGVVDFRGDSNQIDIAETLLAELARVVGAAVQSRQVPETDRIMGFANVIASVQPVIGAVAQQKPERERAKRFSENLKDITNHVKALMQQRMEMESKNNGGIDPETQAKIQTLLLQAKTKDAARKESHAQRTAERAAKFEEEQRQEAMRHQQKMQIEGQKAALEVGKEAALATIDVQKSRAATESES